MRRNPGVVLVLALSFAGCQAPTEPGEAREAGTSAPRRGPDLRAGTSAPRRGPDLRAGQKAVIGGRDRGRDRGRVDQAIWEAADALARAAEFFGTRDGRLAADFLQSSRVPAAERETLAEGIGDGLELPREVASLVQVLANARTLRVLRQVAALASSLAGAFTEDVRVQVRTAMPLPEGVTARIVAAMERILGRPVRVELREDPELLAGVLVKSGDRVWDGSLRGHVARAKESVVVGEARAGA